MGGTKTDLLLFTVEGDYMDFCTQPSPKVQGHVGAIADEIKKSVIYFLKRNQVSLNDIAKITLGLVQIADNKGRMTLTKLLRKALRSENINVMTDGNLAMCGYATNQWAGVYCISGTGEMVLASDIKDNHKSIPGNDNIIAGKSSGNYLHEKAISLLFDSYHRYGDDSIAFSHIIELLKFDKNKLIDSIINGRKLIKSKAKEIIEIMDFAAMCGDNVAVNLFLKAGISAAHSVAGCMKGLDFNGLGIRKNPIPIILMGSIWCKLLNNVMRTSFAKTVHDITGYHFHIVVSAIPPAVGGIIHAKVNKGDYTPDFRKKVMDEAIKNITNAEINNYLSTSPTDADLFRFYMIIKMNNQNVADIFNLSANINNLLKKNPLLSGITDNLAVIFLPAICAIMDKDYDTALHRFAMISRFAQIPPHLAEMQLKLGRSINAAAKI